MGDQLWDVERYPLHDAGSKAFRDVVAAVRADLADHGCSVVPDFVRPELRETLRREGAAVAPRAHYDVATVNVYNIAVDESLPDDHPARIPMRRENAFTARDLIPAETIVHRLYGNQDLQRFVAACFDKPRIHELADPLAGLCLNVVAPGRGHPWHFDTNEFAVSLLTQEPDAGGVFEYCPEIRTAESENFDAVRAVVQGRQRHRVKKLTLHPGDLQLFRGRFAMHRVTAVEGTRQRHTAIFSYTERPGVIGSAARTRQLFGRVLAAHQTGAAVRGDQLLD